jgi:hypothetical protein
MNHLTPDEHDQIEQFIRRTNPQGVPVIGGTPSSAGLSGERPRVQASGAGMSGERPRLTGSSAAISGERKTPYATPAVTPLGATYSTRAIAAWAVAIGLALMAWVLSPSDPILQPMPEAMLGPWHSAHPDYQQATLAFTPERVVIGTRAPVGAVVARPRAHRIVSLQRRAAGDSTIVTLIYDSDDGPMDLQAILVETPTPRLVFPRPEGLTWERGEPPVDGAAVTTPSLPSLQQ